MKEVHYKNFSNKAFPNVILYSDDLPDHAVFGP